MSSYIERYERRRLRSSYISVALSISLVLVLLGALGILLFNTDRLGNYFKEQLVLTAYIKPDAKDIEIEQLIKSLAVSNYVKESTFVSKEEAAAFTLKKSTKTLYHFSGSIH